MFRLSSLPDVHGPVRAGRCDIAPRAGTADSRLPALAAHHLRSLLRAVTRSDATGPTARADDAPAFFDAGLAPAPSRAGRRAAAAAPRGRWIALHQDDAADPRALPVLDAVPEDYAGRFDAFRAHACARSTNAPLLLVRLDPQPAGRVAVAVESVVAGRVLHLSGRLVDAAQVLELAGAEARSMPAVWRGRQARLPIVGGVAGMRASSAA